MGNASFRYHSRHISAERTSCNTCHDPHGISSAQGNSTNNSHLINFNTAVVTPYNGFLYYMDTGVYRGSCQLTCHGEPHEPKTYTP